jgi:hypothetical protein
VADIHNRPLQALMRRSYDEQMRFPLKVVNILSGQFARQGLQFFKDNKSVTHVAVARPRYLDMEATPVSEGVKKIVEFVNAKPRTTRKNLLEALAPGSSVPSAPAAPPAPAVPAAPAEGEPHPVEGQVPTAEAAPAQPAGSTEAQAVVSDLHWLIHQGHVIEFANGILESAKRPLPRPPKPERQPKPGQPQSAEHTESEATGHEVVEGGEGVLAEGAVAEAETATEPEGAPPVADSADEGAMAHEESGDPAEAQAPAAEAPPAEAAPSEPEKPQQ